VRMKRVKRGENCVVRTENTEYTKHGRAPDSIPTQPDPTEKIGWSLVLGV
jgi:hypothetical protein